MSEAPGADREAFSDAMRREGCYEEFIERYGELNVGKNLRPAEAWRTVIHEFATKLGWIKGDRITIPKPGAPSLPPVGKPCVKPVSDCTRDTGPPPAVPDASFACKADFTGKPLTTYLQDAQWVYQNISLADVTAADAPSAGAWWLLLQARDDPKILREAMLVLARKSDVDDDAERGIQAESQRTDSELTEMIEMLAAGSIA